MPIIFEFESFVVQVDYYRYSLMEVHVCDRKSFCEGELTRHICGNRQVNGKTPPFKEPDFALRLHKKIQSVEISGADAFDINNYFYDTTGYYNGDCFYKISLVFNDDKFVIYPKIIDSVNYMYYEFEEIDAQ